MSERIAKEQFYEVLNTQFGVLTEPPNVLSLELFEIVEGHSTPAQEQFALHFRGPLNMHFPQGIRQLEHDKLGTLTLFLVPIARNEDGMVYESVFNRLIKTSEG